MMEWNRIPENVPGSKIKLCGNRPTDLFHFVDTPPAGIPYLIGKECGLANLTISPICAGRKAIIHSEGLKNAWGEKLAQRPCAQKGMRRKSWTGAVARKR